MKVAKLTLEAKRGTPDKNWKKRRKSKKWFDKDCMKLTRSENCWETKT